MESKVFPLCCPPAGLPEQSKNLHDKDIEIMLILVSVLILKSERQTVPDKCLCAKSVPRIFVCLKDACKEDKSSAWEFTRAFYISPKSPSTVKHRLGEQERMDVKPYYKKEA